MSVVDKVPDEQRAESTALSMGLTGTTFVSMWIRLSYVMNCTDLFNNDQ